ncbi:MAG: Tm-1-like ATP-binding domain-containing protein [Gemmatimonadetes bacterium]|nr:Tm-1-like ATP-binding domain-containing protein [Gemmatimonadota bacterium]
MATIVVMGALDTKGAEIAFVKEQIQQRGHRALVVDVGVLGEPLFEAEVKRADVASAGGAELARLVAENDRGRAVTAMSEGAREIALRLLERGEIDGIIGMGGGAGTSVGTAAMRALPLGIPKVMVSTLASSDVRGFVGVKDIMMVPAIVDISGLNRIARGVFTRAAAAVVAMVEAQVPEADDKPTIVASMFGNTTQCVEAARAIVEKQGYEVLIFHAVGVGGQTMESLIEAGHARGVLDVTLTEWADELVGGVLSAGPTRLEAAARTGTPAVIAPGCVDMVNFWGPETIPEHLRNRNIYQHNANTYLVRTNIEENVEMGRIIADKLNLSVGPVAVYLPLRGVSVLASPGNPYHWPEADAALFDSLKSNLRGDIPVHEIDTTINHPEFAGAMAHGLLEMLPASSGA